METRPKSRLSNGKLNPEYTRWYRSTEKGRASVARYNKSEAGAASRRRFEKSVHGKASRKRQKRAARRKLLTENPAKAAEEYAEWVIKTVGQGINSGSIA